MRSSHGVRFGWGLALAATLIAAWLAPASQDASVVLTSRAAGNRSAAHPEGISSAATPPTGPSLNSGAPKTGENSITGLQVLRVRVRSQSENEELAVFSKASWERQSTAVKAQIVNAPLPPSAAPVAPPLPFRFMGRYEERGKRTVFLLQADQSWGVQEGETFAENYKVERIASSAIHLRYLPLNEVQILEFGAAP